MPWEGKNASVDGTAGMMRRHPSPADMTTRPCVQCGSALPQNGKFCGVCGAPNAVDAPSATPALAAAPMAAAKRTMLGVATPGIAPPPRPAPAPTVPDSPPDAPVPATGAAAAPATVPAATAPALAPANRTMLGVAMPGIAPLRAGDRSAPVPATVPVPVAIVPPPAPLQELPAPPSPVIVKKTGGLPLSLVAGIAGVVVLAGGIALALLWRGAPPITAQPRVSADGKDVLHLTCDPASCKDGTTASLGGAKATFAHGEADLPLAAPLHVGDNALSLVIDRPGMGRDETVKLVVPVAYRVRADVTTMTSDHPSITIRVEAPPGSDVRVDDKPVALDASGAGAYAIDESAATEGPADTSSVVSVDASYVVATRGRAPDKGTASARVAVAPLRVDAPGARATVEEDHVMIAGRAAKGASVTVDGAPATVAADGSFETTVPLPGAGDHTIAVRGGTAALMPRTVHVTVTRVASLADAAKSFEQRHPLGYDEVEHDIGGKTGPPIVVDGTVIEARGSGHRTLVLVDDRRGCAHGACLARVVVGRDMALLHGQKLRAYGTVARAFTPGGGQTIPEIDAEFALVPRR